jgi:hypothetical protein
MPPFAEIDGRLYLIINFDLEPIDATPLPELLAGLLAHHAPNEILLLRPLTKAEAQVVRESQREREVEAWAEVVVQDEDRFRGRG